MKNKVITTSYEGRSFKNGMVIVKDFEIQITQFRPILRRLTWSSEIAHNNP